MNDLLQLVVCLLIITICFVITSIAIYNIGRSRGRAEGYSACYDETLQIMIDVTNKIYGEESELSQAKH